MSKKETPKKQEPVVVVKEIHHHHYHPYPIQYPTPYWTYPTTPIVWCSTGNTTAGSAQVTWNGPVS